MLRPNRLGKGLAATAALFLLLALMALVSGRPGPGTGLLAAVLVRALAVRADRGLGRTRV